MNQSQESRKKLRTICIGRIISEYVSEQLGDKIEDIQSWVRCVGGSAANVAFGLAKLNCPVGLIGCVGQDEAGKHLSSLAQAAGIEIEGLRFVSNADTGWLWTLRHPDGQRTFHQPAASFDFFADSLLSKFDLNPKWFDNLSFFVPQSVHLGPETSRECLYFAQELAIKSGTLVVFDINFREFAWPNIATARTVIKDFATKSHILKLEVEESRLIFGTDSIEALASMFPLSKCILLTKGEYGCEYYAFGTFGSLPGYSVTVVDSTGAGDAFLAAFISRLVALELTPLLNQEVFEDSIRFACAAGAVCVSGMGAVESLPTIEEIEKVLTGTLI